jgi:hypothetical protein
MEKSIKEGVVKKKSAKAFLGLSGEQLLGFASGGHAVCSHGRKQAFVAGTPAIWCSRRMRWSTTKRKTIASRLERSLSAK